MNRSIALFGLTMAVSGCAQMFPGKVADGVARLTIRDVGGVLLAANRDEACGFASAQVQAHPVIRGAVGETGTATWTVEGCTIDLGSEPVELSTNCDGVSTMASGKLTVTARKVVQGRVSGDPEAPVIPVQSDAAQFFIDHATFENFNVTKSNSDSHMMIFDGSLKAVVSPRLAADVETGVCSVMTPHIAFTDITWGPSRVEVTSGGKTFEVPIKGGVLDAFNGTHSGFENHLQGNIMVWNSDQSIFLSGAGEGLDPEHDAAAFEQSYTCNDDLTDPVRFYCDLEDAFGDGASKLIVRDFAGLAKAAAADTACGFESPAVLSHFQTDGPVGYAGGTVTYTVEACPIEFKEPVAVATDCHGVTTFVQGKAVVTGTKVVTGWLTGSDETPVVPDSTLPATLTLRADVTDFVVKTSDSDAWLTLQDGRLAGALSPRTLLDTESGACAISSPHALLEDVTFQHGQVELTSGARVFAFRLDGVDLLAVNGMVGDLENHLEGTLVVDGVDVAVPLEGAAPILDPDYDAADFVDSYACTDNAVVPTFEGDCDLTPSLAEGAARLIIKNYGLIAKTIDLDDDCGFENLMGQIGELVSFDVLGGLFTGDLQTLSFDAEGCTVGGTPHFVVEDCVGADYYLDGYATGTGTKTVTGRVVLDDDPLQPRDRRSAEVNFSHIALEDVTALELAPFAGEWEPFLTLHNGTLSGTSLPVTGEAEDDHGAFFIKIPVSEFRDIRLRGSDVTLQNGDMTFKLSVDNSSLYAFNGSYLHDSNWLHGQITVNGTSYDIGSAALPIALDPDFAQSAFDASYECIDNLRGLVPVSY